MTPALLPPVRRRAIAVLAALIVGLLVPWPGLGRGFAHVFAAVSNVFVAASDLGPPTPRFEAPARGAVSAADGGDWAVVLTAGERAAPLDTRIIAYTPLAIFLALVLATPGPRRRKLVMLAGGGAVMLARQALAIMVPLERAFAGAPSALGSFADLAWTVLITPPAMSYATPLAVWWLALTLTTPRPAAAEPARRGRRRAARA